MSYNKKAHLLTNTEAIRIAFALDREERRATEEERAVLRQYSGFGGIKCILNPAEKETDKAYWTKSDMELFPLVVNLHRLIHVNTKSDKESKSYFDSLKSSILTAFYTPPEIIQVLSETLKDKGITPARFLEPSAGNGAFVDAFKQSFPNMETVCFEKDLLTGKILSHLYPDDKVHVSGFEEIEDRPENKFDIVSSNIPFGDTSVFDASFMKSDPVKRQATRAIHNYFFLKGIDTLFEGGLLAFITSQGVMNSPNNEPVREWLMKNTNLVSAIRLPNNLFADNAGTEVGSDLIILQKNSNKGARTSEELLFCKSRTLSNGAYINNYFQNFSRVVHTKGFADTDLYGKPGMTFLHEGGISGMAEDLQKMLAADFSKNLNRSLYDDNAQKTHHSYQPTQKATQSEEKPELFTQPSLEVPKVPTNQQQPLMSLYDLFGISEKERQQLDTKKKNNRLKLTTRPAQPNLFSQSQKTTEPQKAAPPQNTEKQENTPKTPTPEELILKQYHQIKEKHPGTLVFIREGDNYQAIGGDAIRASKILG
ncbi:MAG: N-6 DNA methylase, partial [Tannerella sp.]|nr:N-6 DNA methylase [Tannerella sp.]